MDARKDPFTDAQYELMEAALCHVPFDGFGEKGLAMAAEDLDLSDGDAKMLVPGGTVELVDIFMAWGDKLLIEEAQNLALDQMKIRDRITVLVRKRLQVVDDHQEAVRRGIGILMMPGLNRARVASKGLWRSVDIIWRLAGDTSTDFNYYSKRSLLTGVFISTMAFWLNDSSPDKEDTWSFLERRISDVMQIQTVKFKLQGPKGGVRGMVREGLRRVVGSGPVMQEGTDGSTTRAGFGFPGPFGVMDQLRREFGG